MSLAERPDLPTYRLSWRVAFVAGIRRHALLLSALFCVSLALGVRLCRLGVQSLWLDEGGTWAEVTSKGWAALTAELVSPNAAYPLYHLLLKAWLALAGDSEWALRFPSALAGAGAVAAIFLAARELHPTASLRAPLVAALLLALSPFAIWHAQDAKAYSLLALIITLLLWSFLRALRLQTRRAWLIVLALAVVSVFVHRLALLSLAGLSLAYMLTKDEGRRTKDEGRRTKDEGRRTKDEGRTGELTRNTQHVSRFTFHRVILSRRHLALLLTLILAFVGVVGAVLAVRVEGQLSGSHITAGPLLGLWLTLTHFSLDKGNIAGFLGLPLLVWALPYLALLLWGLLLLVRDARKRQSYAIVVLCAFVVPLALFTVALAFAPLYESRYAMVAFPAWVLVLAYPFREQKNNGTTEQKNKEREANRNPFTLSPFHPFTLSPFHFVKALLVLLFAVNAAVLLQPQHGLFSGAAVKEQWREGIAEFARRAHPDDMLIVHPYYTMPLWSYYAPRVTPDPLPQPIVFTGFAEGLFRQQGQGEFAQLTPGERRERFKREYERDFLQLAQGKKRRILLIAPEHARVIDPPIPGDDYGWIGLHFQYPEAERTWPCGGEKFVGVEVMCQSYPEFFGARGAAAIPEPTIPLSATFGGELRLRGYSLNTLGDVVQAGGALPVTLYWEALVSPTRNYTMFLHLCRDCEAPPLANDDGPPLAGYGDAGQTTTWRIGDPVHDERSLCLPPDLAPGRYTLLLGVYPAGDPAPESRLLVESDAQAPGGTRLVLGEVDVVARSENAAVLSCRR
jgi:hypothetical protein